MPSTILIPSLHPPIPFNYKIKESLKVTKDLRVKLHRKLIFISHIEHVTSKATSVLAFNKRICYGFRDLRALKKYLQWSREVTSSVRQCRLATKNCSDKIAIILAMQKKFILYALRRSVRRKENFRLPSHDSHHAENETTKFELFCHFRSRNGFNTHSCVAFAYHDE